MLDIQPGMVCPAQYTVRYLARSVAPGVITNTVEMDKGNALGGASASAAITAHGYTICLPWVRR